MVAENARRELRPLSKNHRIGRDRLQWARCRRTVSIAEKSFRRMLPMSAQGGEATFALAMERRLRRGHRYFPRRPL